MQLLPSAPRNLCSDSDWIYGSYIGLCSGMPKHPKVFSMEVLQSLQSEHTNDLDVSSSRGHWHFEESRNEQGVSQDVVFR